MTNSGIPLDSFSTFGDLLKYLRRRARLTQRELSIAVKYSEAQISRLEQNQRPPDPAALTALFIPALYVDDEPEVVARLLELAAQARGEEFFQNNVMTFSRSVQHQVVENSRTVEENVRNNLPLQLTSFVGREREITELRNLLEKAKLVTLTGTGGSGKTRLALEAARQFAGSYQDGVWVIELASIVDPNHVLPAVISTLDVSIPHDAMLLKAFTKYLRTKQTLLILDNCEQIVEAAAQLVEEILKSCPQVRILVTSREILNVTAEVQFRVLSLSLPSERSPNSTESIQSEAVQLFLERAQTILPHFVITDSITSAVSQICHLVDGLPLGIELAAAKVSALSVEQIAGRLHDSFQMLGGGRNAVPHHQTLEATIQWSYDLLSTAERVLMQRLSVFLGGWTLEAAEAVASDEVLIPRDKVLGLLSQLINKSMVTVGWQMDAEARYTMLQTIHDFASRKLREADNLKDMRARHFDTFFSLAQEARLFGTEKGKWLDRLESEHDNLRSALAWSLEANMPEKGAALILPILDFYWHRGFSTEALEWMNKFLERESPASPQQALLLQKAGWLTRAGGHFEKADKLLNHALQMALEIGDKNRASWALMDMGLSARDQGDNDQAVSLFSQALTFAKESGENRAIGGCLYSLAECYDLTGELDTSRTLWEQGLNIMRMEDDPTHIARGLEGIAGTAFLAKDFAGALKFHLESLQFKLDVMDKLGITYSLEGLAQISAASHKPEQAAVLWGAANRLREALNVPIESSREEIYTSLMPGTRDQIGGDIFDKAWKKGKTMTLQEAIDFALALIDG